LENIKFENAGRAWPLLATLSDAHEHGHYLWGIVMWKE